jgi:hypothetical protein
MVSPLIERKDARMRQAVSLHERLTATLRFLATGRTYEGLKYSANNLATSDRQNYTTDVLCHLQSTEEGLSEGKDMNMRCFLNNLLINLFIIEISTFNTNNYQMLHNY